MAPTRRSSRRSGGPVDYSEAVLDFEADDEEALEADEVARAAKKKLAARELAKERAARVKRDEDDADFGKLTYKEKKKKKQEKAKRVANKDAGKLSSIFALPMDLLAVIFSELEPLNLLHLSRANKQLNTFLSSRDASPIWAACRNNLVIYVPKEDSDVHFDDDTGEETYRDLEPLHIPARPANLTDIAYAHVLFENTCTFCPSTHPWLEYWSLGIKFCRSCFCKPEPDFTLHSREKAIEQLGKELRRGNIDETVFDLVPCLGNDQYWMGGLVKMQDKLKEAKRTLKKKELEAWIEAKKEAAKEGREKGPLIMKYVREFKVHGKDEVRRKRYQKYLLKTRREIAMTACAVAEPWYDREIWREYIRGGRADRLLNKNCEFTQAEWQSSKAAVETEIEKRKAFLQPFRDYDAGQPARNWIRNQARMRIPTAVKDDYDFATNLTGDILHLPAAQALLAIIPPAYKHYHDDNFAAYQTEMMNCNKLREATLTACLPELTRQLRDRQIEIFSDLVDKLAAKGSAPQTSAELLATIPYLPTTNDKELPGEAATTAGEAHAATTSAEEETSGDNRKGKEKETSEDNGKGKGGSTAHGNKDGVVETLDGADTGTTHHVAPDAPATGDKDIGDPGADGSALNKGDADADKNGDAGEDVKPVPKKRSLRGSSASSDAEYESHWAKRTALEATLTKDDDPQVMAVRILHQALSSLQARFACHKCEVDRIYGPVQLMSVPEILSHSHFTTTEQHRHYDLVERGLTNSHYAKMVPSQWQMDLVHHPQHAKFTHDTMMAIVHRHNTTVEARAQAEAAVKANLDTGAGGSGTKGNGKASGKGKGRKGRAKVKAKGKDDACDGAKDCAPTMTDGEAAADAEAGSSGPLEASAKMAATDTGLNHDGSGKPVIPGLDAARDVIALPESRVDAAAFDLKYRLVCSHSAVCAPGAYHSGAHWPKSSLRTWCEMVDHIAAHYVSAQESRETLIKASAVKIIKKPPPPPVPAYVPPAHGGFGAFGGLDVGYDSFDSELGYGSDGYNSVMDEIMEGMGY